eukprot:7325630-Prymnesium_polylepis.1
MLRSSSGARSQSASSSYLPKQHAARSSASARSVCYGSTGRGTMCVCERATGIRDANIGIPLERERGEMKWQN